MNKQGLDISINLICLAILIPLIILVLCIILSNTQIIIDIKERTVRRKSLFENKKIGLLENVNRIQYSESGSIYILQTYMYELIFKDDIYGAGIRLTPTLRKRSKKMKEIYYKAIVKIEELLTENTIIEPNITAIEQKLHLFHEIHRERYCYQEKSLTLLIFIVLPFVLFMYLEVFEQLDSYYHYIMLLISTAFLLLAGKKVNIDINNQTVESSFYGFFKSKCHFSEIDSITIVKLLYEGSYTTNISIRTNRDKKPYEIPLASIKDTKKVALFINDLMILLPSINKKIKII
ncbi:hypothetical protein G7050_14950 [Dysgonomonas sp. HDW5A]|uniref:hypothetical protein n=1 Tax=Dysgonomonas sp. HDW5A TaxID=2714926 RepID=UPI00140BBB66|nr:hypothetical protein [Dysgonomonas sp. HDW5A]QIK61064.1 hypothetical protein G7050_14950 [Dysgonomonas sp. HDW5A]